MDKKPPLFRDGEKVSISGRFLESYMGGEYRKNYQFEILKMCSICSDVLDGIYYQVKIQKNGHLKDVFCVSERKILDVSPDPIKLPDELFHIDF